MQIIVAILLRLIKITLKLRRCQVGENRRRTVCACCAQAAILQLVGAASGEDAGCKVRLSWLVMGTGNRCSKTPMLHAAGSCHDGIGCCGIHGLLCLHWNVST